MRIATFNVESLDMPPKAMQSLEERARVLRPELLRARADILCLQEVNGQRLEGSRDRGLLALERVIEGTDYASYHRAVSTPMNSDTIADVHNLVTLSRFPMVRTQSIQHEKVPPIHYTPVTAVPPVESGQDLIFDRPVLACDIELSPGRVVRVINCHLRAPLASPVAGQKAAAFVWKSVSGWAEGYCISSIKRNAQALEVRLAVDEMLADDPAGEVVVCGDFNAAENEPPIRILIGAEHDTGNGALAEKALVLLDRNIPSDRRYSVIDNGRPQMLDHMLCSRPLYSRFVKAEIFNEGLSDEAVSGARVQRPAGSFHACMVAEFVD